MGLHAQTMWTSKTINIPKSHNLLDVCRVTRRRLCPLISLKPNRLRLSKMTSQGQPVCKQTSQPPPRLRSLHRRAVSHTSFSALNTTHWVFTFCISISYTSPERVSGSDQGHTSRSLPRLSHHRGTEKTIVKRGEP